MDSIGLVCSTANGGDAGVYAASFDEREGRLRSLTSTLFDSPTYIAAHPDGRTVYTVSRTAGDGVVSAFHVDDEGGLRRLNDRSSHGAGPCYVSVDDAGQHVFVANYDGGSVAAFPIGSDGRLGEVCDTAQHNGSSIVPDRQASPHPHSIVPGPEGRFVYVPDLGTDRIVGYRFDRGPLQPVERLAVKLPPGSGPRHLAFGPDGESAFLVNELDSTAAWLTRDPDSGALSVLDTTSTLPDDVDPETSKGADVHVHPSGQWVYVSNRGHDSIAVLEPRRDSLRWVGCVPSGGRKPRDFALHPNGRWLFTENRDSDIITTFAVDDRTGELRPTDAVLSVPYPTAMVVVDR